MPSLFKGVKRSSKNREAGNINPEIAPKEAVMIIEVMHFRKKAGSRSPGKRAIFFEAL